MVFVYSSMQKQAVLLLPNHLFEEHPAFQKDRLIIFLEEELFFKQYAFHQQKILFHRASMKAFEQQLKDQGYSTTYINAHEKSASLKHLHQELKNQELTELHLCYPADNWVEKRIKQTAQTNRLTLHWYSNPGFLLQPADADLHFNKRSSFFQTDFYIWHRKQLNILLDEKKQPVGGKWSFDAENREKIPKGLKIPALPVTPTNAFIDEAIDYCTTNFSDNPGTTSHFNYAVTHTDARYQLQQFLEQRLANFGAYEDAMIEKESHLFHSVLTPYLNTGLITPREVVEQTLSFANDNQIPINSLEGFIRQIIGWREFIHQVYQRAGSRQRTRNYWGFKRPIPPAFYTGETGIHPIDSVIKKLQRTAYNHHIERLMVLGNFFLLCEFDPDSVYKWFMEFYIDSYDWVMVPNVYGMTQFADGGLMTTKPYISGSNYLLKMGDWKKGPWQSTWDGLFWRFMHVHRDFFLSNPRLGMLVKTFDKMAPQKQALHLQHAEDFLNQLDQWNQQH